jgi:hypothetical protein
MIFQIVDDFDDSEEDSLHERTVNSVLILGEEGALSLLKEEAKGFQETLNALRLNCPSIEQIVSYLLKAADRHVASCCK